MAVVEVAVLSMSTLTGQIASSPVPRTADGQPDLQGVWNYSTITPLERPSELAGKGVLTDAEAAEWLKQRLELTNPDRRDAAAKHFNGGVSSDLERAYNKFWYDYGTDVVGDKRTSLIVDPTDGTLPPLTAEAKKREAARSAARSQDPKTPHLTGSMDGPENRPLAERCMFNSGPPMLPGAYNNNIQIVQGQGYVVIVNEMIHNARVVPLDGRSHLDATIRQWTGDSRGRWEGDTLVVDTTNFTGRTEFRGSTAKLHLIERFKRIDVGRLRYEFTVDDPTTWTRPWTAVVPMSKSQDLIYEYACHEGNYGLANALSAARAAEEKDKARTEGLR
jgi:hypothetical protein